MGALPGAGAAAPAGLLPRAALPTLPHLFGPPALQSVGDEALARMFRAFPGMEYCDLKKDRMTGRSKVGGTSHTTHAHTHTLLIAGTWIAGSAWLLRGRAGRKLKGSRGHGMALNGTVFAARTAALPQLVVGAAMGPCC